jgi:hypothetical protein
MLRRGRRIAPSKFVVQIGEVLFASRVGVQADNDFHGVGLPIAAHHKFGADWLVPGSPR